MSLMLPRSTPQASAARKNKHFPLCRIEKTRYAASSFKAENYAPFNQRNQDMRPKIKTGYPVTIHGHTFTKVGVVYDASAYDTRNTLQVVYVDAAFKARRTTVVWKDDRFEWSEPSYPGVNVENDPDVELYVTTVKNGRY